LKRKKKLGSKNLEAFIELLFHDNSVTPKKKGKIENGPKKNHEEL